jgi:DUF4097 and DUF4098 domain-containing protein YvlB
MNKSNQSRYAVSRIHGPASWSQHQPERKRLLVFGAAVVFVIGACVARGERSFKIQNEETIKRTLEFSPGNGTKVFEVDNVNGSIRVIGYDGRNVEMTAVKTISAASEDKVETAKREVKLDITDNADTIEIYVDQPGHEHSKTSSSHSHWTNHWYEVSFDFDIRVPRATTLHLWTVNDGEIDVRSISGEFDVNNINGGIEMRDISGSGRAHTINGPVTVMFTQNPKADSSFASLNGKINVTLQRNLNADLMYKTFNGGIYTDFDVTVLPRVQATATRRNGKFVYKSNDFSSARVGNGGPTLEFDAFNGDVRIMQAK